jgi:hypothetical protein
VWRKDFTRKSKRKASWFLSRPVVNEP